MCVFIIYVHKVRHVSTLEPARSMSSTKITPSRPIESRVDVLAEI